MSRAMAVHLSSQGVSLVLGYADALAAPLPRAVTVRADASDEGSARSPSMRRRAHPGGQRQGARRHVPRCGRHLGVARRHRHRGLRPRARRVPVPYVRGPRPTAPRRWEQIVVVIVEKP